MHKTALIISLLLSAFLTDASCQTSFGVAFWNVENLFDTTNSSNTIDEDFTPGGRYAWDESKLAEKLDRLSQVIVQMDSEHNLGILGLAEIENAGILERLNAQHLKAGFKIIHRESPDERGIDCAILYDPEAVKLQSRHFIPVQLSGGEKTRDILEAAFVVDKGVAPLHVFINHWPSRWGGQLETEPYRIQAARTIRSRIDEILSVNASADIIIMGDFNDNPDDKSIHEILRARDPAGELLPGDLVNASWNLHQNPEKGTYVYKGSWQVLDQTILSSAMFDTQYFRCELDDVHTFSPAYLFEKEGRYTGWPFRMYRSGKYQGGYSDHLPILCKVQYKP